MKLNSPDKAVSATAPSEADEEDFNIQCYLEKAHLRCTDPILISFASYCIVIPMNGLQDRKLLCHLKIHSPPQQDWYNASFVEYTRDDNGKMGFLECNKRMHNCGDFLVGVNEIHLKGWDGNECFELINIDKSTAELANNDRYCTVGSI